MNVLVADLMTYDILIAGVTLLDLSASDHSGSLLENAFIATTGNTIAAIGPMTAMPPATSGKILIDGSGKLAMPGLVNGHCHGAMTLFRGLADDLPLKTWLEEHIFPAERQWVTPEMVYWCTKLAAAEMLLSGTTCVADGYFHEDQAAAAFADAGIRAIAAQGIIDFPAPGVADPADNIATAGAFLEQWHGRNERITPAVFCHSPYTCSPATIVKAKELARHGNVPLFIHLSETLFEQEYIRIKHGTTPTLLLDRLGVLDRQTVCVHCVWCSDEDIAILAARDAAVCTCPQSNMKLASGVAPVRAITAAGVRTALGTDGCASNNSLDLFAEMKALALLHKAMDKDPTSLPARQALWLATRGGAEALLPGAALGTLAKYSPADIVLIDLDVPALTPFHGSDSLVYAAGGHHVGNVIVNGKEIVRQGRIISFDLDETLTAVRALARPLPKGRQSPSTL